MKSKIVVMIYVKINNLKDITKRIAVVRLPGKPQSELDKEIAKEEAEYFSFQLNEARESGRYPLHVAAKLIAQAAGVFTSETTMEERLILAAHEGSLPVYAYGEILRWARDIPFCQCRSKNVPNSAPKVYQLIE